VKRVVGYASVFVLVFIVSIVVYLPANVVLKQVSLPPQLQLNGVQGTIWQGSADQVRWRNYNFGNIRWSLNLSAMATAKLEAAVRFGQGSDVNLYGKGIVGYSSDGLYAENLVLSVPADEALKQFPIPVPVVANGQLELTLKNYIYQAPFCLSGDGSLAWSSANVESPLGNLTLEQPIADIQCQSSVVDVKGSQQSVQVTSEFSATLSPNRRYQAQAWFKPGAEFPESLGNQLKWLPKPDNQGRYAFKHQGRL